MIWLEELMYRASGYFLAPVLLLLALLFAYACYALGEFLVMAWQRRKHRSSYQQALATFDFSKPAGPIPGYPLYSLAVRQGRQITKDILDIAAMNELEGVRAASRIAPMLGLVATMIPMGPALKSLANGNIQGISENLIVAFSAVIFGLVIATVTFWVASHKKRWLATELADVNAAAEAALQSADPEIPQK